MSFRVSARQYQNILTQAQIPIQNNARQTTGPTHDATQPKLRQDAVTAAGSVSQAVNRPGRERLGTGGKALKRICFFVCACESRLPKTMTTPLTASVGGSRTRCRSSSCLARHEGKGREQSSIYKHPVRCAVVLLPDYIVCCRRSADNWNILCGKVIFCAAATAATAATVYLTWPVLS